MKEKFSRGLPIRPIQELMNAGRSNSDRVIMSHPEPEASSGQMPGRGPFLPVGEQQEDGPTGQDSPRWGSRILLLVSLALLGSVLTGAGLFALDMPRFRLHEEEARETFKKAIKYYNHRNYGAAREMLVRALEVAPDFHLARKYLGEAHYYSGQWNEAMEEWGYLGEVSGGGLPLVQMRNQLMHFSMGGYRDPGPYIHLKSYHNENLKEASIERPVDIAPLPGAGLFLLDYGAGRLYGINPSGQTERSWMGSIWNSFEGPVAMDVHEDRIYIADYSSDTLRVLNKEGRQVQVIGKTGQGPGEFHGPVDLQVHNGYLYVIDSGNRRIQKFDLQGNAVDSYALRVNGQQLESPYGLAVDQNDRFYVSDVKKATINIFDGEGNFLGTLNHEAIKKPRLLSIKDGKIYIADELSGIMIYDPEHRSWRVISHLPGKDMQNRSMAGAYSVKVDDDGLLYVARFRNRQTDILIPAGLKTSNFDVHIENIQTERYPGVAIFLRVKNRLGNDVHGLTKREFMIYENDRRIGLLRSNNVKYYNKRVNMSVVVEQTPAMQKELSGDIRAVMETFLQNIRVVDSISLFQAAGDSRHAYSGLQRKTILKNLLGKDTSSQPNLGKGIYEGLVKQLDKLGSRNVLLVVSGEDHESSFRQYSPERLVQFARSHGIHIDVLSFQRTGTQGVYRDLAEKTGGKTYFAYDDTDIAAMYTTMKERKDDRYILTYRSNATRLPSDRPVEVRVEVRHLETTGKDTGIYFKQE